MAATPNTSPAPATRPPGCTSSVAAGVGGGNAGFAIRFFRLIDPGANWGDKMSAVHEANHNGGMISVYSDCKATLTNIDSVPTTQTWHKDGQQRMDASSADTSEISKKYKFVSLGEDCFPRTVLTRWGLKPSAECGEKSHPFDLAVHTITGIAGVLEARFEGYLDSANLFVSESEDVIRNRHHDVCYNHESPEIYAANDYAELRARYNRRIGNFYSDIDEAERVVFLIHAQNPNATPNYADEDLNRIAAAVRKTWPRKNYHIISVVTWPADAEISVTANKRNFIRFDINYPLPGYIWHDQQWYATPEGVEFEKIVIDRIVKQLAGQSAFA